MRYTTSILVSACMIALVNSLPVSIRDNGLQSPALDQLVMVEDVLDDTDSDRNKRTIGVLRQFFPELTEMIEKKVNMIIAEVIKVLGPTLLKSVLGRGALGGRPGGANSDEGSTATVASPFEDELEDNSKPVENDSSKISVVLPTFPSDGDDVAVTTTSKSSRVSRDLRSQDHSVDGSENNEVRVAFEDNPDSANEAIQSELTPLEDIEVGDDENRNKRLAGLSGGSGSGSGNFIFDVIRQIIAGSGSSGDSSSGDQSPSKNEAEEPVPGPATRLLVIANRGISNLIQDLILRIAATSERFVNFKARLITSII